MKEISVEVVLALPGRQERRCVWLPQNATVVDALRASGLPAEFPEIDLSRVGIYGKPVTGASRVEDGDRVEIYRPLKVDPMEGRVRRAGGRRAEK